MAIVLEPYTEVCLCVGGGIWASEDYTVSRDEWNINNPVLMSA